MFKAFFMDKSVIVEVETPFDPESLYVLWRARKEGARVWVPCKVGSKIVMLDIAQMNADKTFEAVIIGNFKTEPPPPPSAA
jgi:hypothetical protein